MSSITVLKQTNHLRIAYTWQISSSVLCFVLTKINIDQKTTGEWFFPQSKSIVEEEVIVVCLGGQPLKSFYVGLFHFGDKQGRIHSYPSRVRVGRGHI